MQSGSVADDQVGNEMVAAIAGPTRAQLAEQPDRLRVRPEEHPVAMQTYGRETKLCAELARAFVASGAPGKAWSLLLDERSQP